MLFYRILATLAAPLLGAAFLWRVLRGRETWRDLGERLGAGPGNPGALWLHGASNGELAAARHLAQAIRTAFPDKPLLVTSNTTTARTLVESWNDPHITARLAPLDLRWVLNRVRRHWQPAALIILENELWPNRIATIGAPTLLLSARMSSRSARRWAFLSGLTRHLLRQITRLYPQDAASGQRFIALGLPPDRLGPTAVFKSGINLPNPPPETIAQFRSIFPRSDTVLAASTHEGDEALILHAFQAARATRPDLRLIIAPRHPRRSAEVSALINLTGLSHAIRSEGPFPTEGCTVYLADTMGEMPLWYALAGTTIIGGSFSNRGGHTPFEPAQYTSAIIHGPDMANFTESFTALHQQNAAIQVQDSVSLANALTALAGGDARATMAARASEVLDKLDTSNTVIADIIADLKTLLRQ